MSEAPTSDINKREFFVRVELSLLLPSLVRDEELTLFPSSLAPSSPPIICTRPTHSRLAPRILRSKPGTSNRRRIHLLLHPCSRLVAFVLGREGDAQVDG